MLLYGFRFTDHALEEMERRRLTIEIVKEVLMSPDQVSIERGTRLAYQSRVVFPNRGTYLVRVIVDTSDTPPTVRTVYRTSKILKYWRSE